MQKLAFPMRETMPYFVCSLRQVDEWKRFQARQSQVVMEAAYDSNAKYVKSLFAQSLNIEDLLRFLDDTALDIEFMVQLPSIEKCLSQWWKVYAKDQPALEPDQFRQVYYDLANVLVQAKTENIHKNSVSTIMRSGWTKWTAKELPLVQPEFFRLMFALAHLMTESNRLADYVTFFQETLAKITRASQSKAKRSETHKRKPRVHRKSSLEEIMSQSGSLMRMHIAVNQLDGHQIPGALGGGVPESTSGSSFEEARSANGGRGVVNVTLQRVYSSQSTSLSDVDSLDLDEPGADQFVEVLDRRGVYSQKGAAQHVVIDPLLLERRFQDKWKRPAHARTLSTEDALRELHPLTNKYVPPLCVARLHTSPPTGAVASGLLHRQCQSTPALKVKRHESHDLDVDAVLKAALAVRDEREDEVLRRSLSSVALKSRVERNKTRAKKPVDQARQANSAVDLKSKQGGSIYLAIST